MDVREAFVSRAEKRGSFWRMLISLPNGWAISILAGAGLYCTPRRESLHPSAYSEVEAVIFGEGENVLSPEEIAGLADDLKSAFQQSVLAYAPWEIVQALYDFLSK